MIDLSAIIFASFCKANVFRKTTCSYQELEVDADVMKITLKGSLQLEGRDQLFVLYRNGFLAWTFVRDSWVILTPLMLTSCVRIYITA